MRKWIIKNHKDHIQRVTLNRAAELRISEFEAELKSAGEKLIVVDFSAAWCGPCKMIKPFFHVSSLSLKIVFCLFQDVATHCDVKCMPTFQFYKNGKKVQEFSGANKEKLEETIKSLI
uniref:Thioredoxin n=1 Tax=Buteo japonicus TaxID=224669 RepID=A0A8C0BAV3_9AVES